MYVYNGRPAYAKSRVPSLRVMVVNGAGYAAFAVPGTLGQTFAHCPEHADAPGVAEIGVEYVHRVRLRVDEAQPAG